MTRILCIVDTCAVLNLCDLRLAGQKLLEHAQVYMNMFAPKEVSSELTKQGNQEQATFSKNIESAEDYECCLKVLQRWFDIQGKHEDFRKLAEADRSCLALALHKSRSAKNVCVLVTDDGRARRIARDFVKDQLVGPIVSTPEIIIYVYSMTPSIRKNDALAAISDYFSRNLARELVATKEPIIKQLEYSCRNLTQSLCLSKCRV